MTAVVALPAWWWEEDRLTVVAAARLLCMVVVCRSSSDFMLPKSLDRPEMLCAASSPMAEVTDVGLKLLVGLIWLACVG